MTTAEAPDGPSRTTGAGRSPSAERSAFWLRTLRGWDIAFYVMMAIGALAVLLESRGVADGTRWALLLMAVLVVAYTLIARRAARTGSRGLALVYLAVLIALATGIVLLDTVGTILLFIAYSQIWFFADSRRLGVLLSLVLTVGVFGALVVAVGPDRADLPSAITQGAIALAFAVLLGLWITNVAEQSEERAALIEQLEAAQAELGRSQHAAGVTAERERMAREIHDTLAQGFTSVIMLAQTASSDLRRGRPDQAAERLQLVERTARDNLAEARALVAAFSPVGLEGSTLAEALARLASRFTQETGVRVEVVLRHAAATPSRDQEVILLRAAQEALANVRRHAHARHVQLVLGAEPGAGREGGAVVNLEVVDDGRGIDPGATEGFGLRGMRERVTSGGGEVAVSPRAEGGTRVRVTLPADDVAPDVGGAGGAGGAGVPA
ncbi:sensor histidine kinase [Actinotalea ferrariae]|uniref:sensor histidine kinase n=1 Tax=Actinotalea ferrariae TaxID=1386098 RepID=UPI001C8C9987|nr:sensor histidine kinase [Actinotalea ferrariae]MBX9245113.1 sensor histidine kinase [Actinotalea ferrariae]